MNISITLKNTARPQAVAVRQLSTTSFLWILQMMLHTAHLRLCMDNKHCPILWLFSIGWHFLGTICYDALCASHNHAIIIIHHYYLHDIIVFIMVISTSSSLLYHSPFIGKFQTIYFNSCFYLRHFFFFVFVILNWCINLFHVSKHVLTCLSMFAVLYFYCCLFLYITTIM